MMIQVWPESLLPFNLRDFRVLMQVESGSASGIKPESSGFECLREKSPFFCSLSPFLVSGKAQVPVLSPASCLCVSRWSAVSLLHSSLSVRSRQCSPYAVTGRAVVTHGKVFAATLFEIFSISFAAQLIGTTFSENVRIRPKIHCCPTHLPFFKSVERTA